MYVSVCFYIYTDTYIQTYIYKFLIMLHTLTSLFFFPCLYMFPQILLPMLYLLDL